MGSVSAMSSLLTFVLLNIQLTASSELAASNELAATSYTPKSLSSGGQRFSWGHTQMESDIAHPGKAGMHSLEYIDNRLESLTERMQNFEADLCDTVDSILLLLGHKPTRHKEVDPDQTTSVHVHIPPPKKGPRLVKSPSDLARLLENM